MLTNELSSLFQSEIAHSSSQHYAMHIFFKYVGMCLSQRAYRLVCHLIELVRVVAFNVTFNNISIISWRSVLLVEETAVSGENH